MAYEYRRTRRIQSIDNEGKWVPMQLGNSLLNDVIMSGLPTTDKQVDEDKKNEDNQSESEGVQ